MIPPLLIGSNIRMPFIFNGQQWKVMRKEIPQGIFAAFSVMFRGKAQRSQPRGVHGGAKFHVSAGGLTRLIHSFLPQEGLAARIHAAIP